LASTRLIAPSGAMAKADTDPAPFPVKPKRPSAVTTAQHGAPWCVETAPLTSAACRSRPARRTTPSPPLPTRTDRCVGRKRTRTVCHRRRPSSWGPRRRACVYGVHVEQIGVLLGDHKVAAVGAELHLRRADGGARKEHGSARDRCEVAAGTNREARDVSAAARVQHVKHVACTVRLIGRVPPEAVRLASARPAGLTANTDTSLEPALTANSRRPSLLNETALCEPRLAPVPAPPVATVPAP